MAIDVSQHMKCSLRNIENCARGYLGYEYCFQIVVRYSEELDTAVMFDIGLFFIIEMQLSPYITEKLTVMFGSFCLFPCSKMNYYCYYCIVSFCSIILQTPFNSYFTQSKTWML